MPLLDHRFRNSDNQGFTLLEVLVSMVILAVAMTAIMQLFSGGMRLRRIATQYTHATLYARSLMDRVLLQDQLAEGIRSGVDEVETRSYHWQTEIEQILSEDLEDQVPEPDLLRFHITVKVRWESDRGSKQIKLETIALAESKENDPLLSYHTDR